VTSDRKPASVVVVGGGYGGITAAKALDEVTDVVLVDPKDSFEHNVAALRALVDPSWSSRIHFSYDGLLKHGHVIRDRAVKVDSRRVVLESGTELVPDFIVLATGSSYPFPGNSGAESAREAAALFRDGHDALAGANRVLLLGAGPVGIELAGEIAAAWPTKHVTTSTSSMISSAESSRSSCGRSCVASLSGSESSSCSEVPCTSHHPRPLACQVPSLSPRRPARRSRPISGFAATA
jgi:NADH dehydrogenase FAD-containing subunit